MPPNHSLDFFERQFQRQVAAREFAPNPFETAALPYLAGRVLDYGCGLGNLALAAARRGCHVLALDASATAIAHLQTQARQEGLALAAEQADLRQHRLHESFDAVVCIGLLMFFDGATAARQLAQLQRQVRPGGVAVVNLLVAGTTYMEMFAAQEYCLWTAAELRQRFAGWDLLEFVEQEFQAPGGTVKRFATAVARRAPQAG